MENKESTKKHKQQVVMPGETFESITAFCNAYDLKYATTSLQLRKGISPEEIVANRGTLPTTTRYRSDSRAAIPCSYDEVNYPSISVAAEALGIPPHRISTCMKTRKCSVNDAIRYLMEDKEVLIDIDTAGRREPCVVEGVLYPSRAAACQAYGVKYISVYSRMRRNNISFEEALASGGIARRNARAMVSVWDELSLKAFTPAEKDNVLIQLADVFTKAGFTWKLFYDAKCKVAAIMFNISLHTISEFRDIYLLTQYPPCGNVVDIELLIPELYKDKLKPLNYDLLNTLNMKYCGACLGSINGVLRASTALSVTVGHINSRTTLRTLLRFVGTSSAMYDEYTTHLIRETG